MAQSGPSSSSRGGRGNQVRGQTNGAVDQCRPCAQAAEPAGSSTSADRKQRLWTRTWPTQRHRDRAMEPHGLVFAQARSSGGDRHRDADRLGKLLKRERIELLHSQTASRDPDARPLLLIAAALLADVRRVGVREAATGPAPIRRATWRSAPTPSACRSAAQRRSNKPYEVLASGMPMTGPAAGRERRRSWYGRKFHGQPTQRRDLACTR